MASKGSADVPPGLKPVKPYLSVAKEHDVRDPVVAYYCKYSASVLTHKIYRCFVCEKSSIALTNV